MRQVREILRLTLCNEMPAREVARRVGIAPSTVRATVERFRSSGLTWPLSEDVTEEVLEDQLYGRAGTKRGHRRHGEPDWAQLHRELKRKHVTLSILWEEYIEQHPRRGARLDARSSIARILSLRWKGVGADSSGRKQPAEIQMGQDVSSPPPTRQPAARRPVPPS